MYAKQSGATLAKDDGKFYVVFNRSIYEVNEVGARIFDLCNGKNSILEMSNKLSSMFDVEKENLEKDIEIFINSLLEYGVIYAKDI